jgi:tetratricopeptide (TPR) repeat protein
VVAVQRRAHTRPPEAVYELLYFNMLLKPGAPQTAAVAKQLEELRAQAEATAPEPPPELEAIFSYLDDAATDQHEAALATIRDLAQTSGQSSFVPRLLLARSCVATSRLAEAEKVYTSLVAEDPSSVPALVGLAELYFMENREESANRTLARALQLDPANTAAKAVVDAWKGE